MIMNCKCVDLWSTLLQLEYHYCVCSQCMTMTHVVFVVTAGDD